MEITKQNGGESLGFKEEENAIFIDENNYKEKYDYYIKTRNDPKWEALALNARAFVLNNYTTAHGVNRLVEYIKEKV